MIALLVLAVLSVAFLCTQAPAMRQRAINMRLTGHPEGSPHSVHEGLPNCAHRIDTRPGSACMVYAGIYPGEHEFAARSYANLNPLRNRRRSHALRKNQKAEPAFSDYDGCSDHDDCAH